MNARIDQWTLKAWAPILIALLAGAPITTTTAELTLGTPPRLSEEESRRLYEPLARHLGKVLGTPVGYARSATWLAYQRDLREGRFQLAFDAPHFVAWRMMNTRHQPLVNLPSPLQYHLVAVAGAAAPKDLAQLIAKRICAVPPPNLGTMLLQNEYTNPIRQPTIVPVTGEDAARLDALRGGRCEAAVLTNLFWEHGLPATQRSELAVVHSTGTLPNLALSAGPEISVDQRHKIIVSLTEDAAGIAATKPLLERYDPAAGALAVSDSSEYIVHNYFLLQGVVFGW